MCPNVRLDLDGLEKSSPSGSFLFSGNAIHFVVGNIEITSWLQCIFKTMLYFYGSFLWSNIFSMQNEKAGVRNGKTYFSNRGRSGDP